MLRSLFNNSCVRFTSQITRRISRKNQFHRYFSSQSDISTQELLVTRSNDGYFATLTLNRPEKHNALSNTLSQTLRSTFQSLRDSEKLRAGKIRIVTMKSLVCMYIYMYVSFYLFY